MVCFGLNPLVQGLSVALYQEMLGIALFYLLLVGGVLEGRRSPLLWLAAAAALVNRDTFWIYLLVVSALNWRSIFHQRADRPRVRAAVGPFQSAGSWRCWPSTSRRRAACPRSPSSGR